MTAADPAEDDQSIEAVRVNGMSVPTPRAQRAPSSGEEDVTVPSRARVVGVSAAPPMLAVSVAVVAGLGAAWTIGLVVAGAIVSAGLVSTLVVGPLLAAMASARLCAEDLSCELARERTERDLRDRLDRALSGTESEMGSLRIGLRAVSELLPGAEVALLLSKPDEPRIGWSSGLVDGVLRPAVVEPAHPSCLALSEGRLVTSASSRTVDACSHLGDGTDEVSGVCVPLRVGERTIGVVSVIGAPGEVPDPATLRTLEWIVARTGDRVAEQRRARGPSTPGPQDPVTGLPGAVALRSHLRDLVRALTPFCVAVITVDGAEEFSRRNGADDLDEALRLTADALTATLRPDDVVCRLDGARFAAVLTQCDRAQAAAALERVREALVLSIAAEESPHFTCSAGIVESHRATSLEEIMSMADAACVAANLQGGNRVAVAD